MLRMAPKPVCIRGGNRLLTSASVWHFMQGHLLEVFTLLHVHGLYDRRLRLTFDKLPFQQTWGRYLDFYLAVFDIRPKVASYPHRCAVHSRSLWLPAFELDTVDNFPEAEFGHAIAFSNSSLHRACSLLPAVHRAAAEIRSARPRGRRPFRMVLLHRTGMRRMINAGEVEQQLRQLATSHGWLFSAVHFDTMPPLEQVDLMLETDVLISYHGAGIGSSHIWMPEGAVIVEIAPPNWPYCLFSVCAAMGGHAWVQSSAAVTVRAEAWKPGGFRSSANSRISRSVVLQPVHRLLQPVMELQVGGKRWQQGWRPRDALMHLASQLCVAPPSRVERARAWAARYSRSQTRCAPACGGEMLQLWEPMNWTSSSAMFVPLVGRNALMRKLPIPCPKGLRCSSSCRDTFTWSSVQPAR